MPARLQHTIFLAFSISSLKRVCCVDLFEADHPSSAKEIKQHAPFRLEMEWEYRDD